MGNGAVHNKPHNKRLIHKYLGELFDTTCIKYSKSNPKHKYVRPYCIISVTNCEYSAITRVSSNLIILHRRIFLQVYNTS